MLKTKEIVINTSPTIAIIAALGDLKVLQALYQRVLVPYEVCQEIQAHSSGRFGQKEFEDAEWLYKTEKALEINPILNNLLDRGEASVIQLALDNNITTVCIDEIVGRRVARLSGLNVTGSIGILIRAKKEGYTFSMQNAINRMKAKGIWISETVVNFALNQTSDY